MILILIGLVIFTADSFSTNPVTDEEKLMSVVAGSGLKMRTAPKLSAQTIKVIPFGDMVFPVIDTAMTETVEDRIEWMEGEWIKVEHMGDQGYVFNGFLTHLPVPQFDFELTYEDMDLVSPLESYVSYRFDRDGEPVIYDNNDEIKMVTKYEGGHKKTEIEDAFMYQIKVVLNDTEIHEAYNLLKGMLLTGYEKTTYEQNAVFVENKYGEISKIRINIDMPIEIKQLPGNQVQIRVTNYSYGHCGL